MHYQSGVRALQLLLSLCACACVHVCVCCVRVRARDDKVLSATTTNVRCTADDPCLNFIFRSDLRLRCAETSHQPLLIRVVHRIAVIFVDGDCVLYCVMCVCVLAPRMLRSLSRFERSSGEFRAIIKLQETCFVGCRGWCGEVCGSCAAVTLHLSHPSS